MNRKYSPRVDAALDRVLDAAPDDRQHILSEIERADAELAKQVTRLYRYAVSETQGVAPDAGALAPDFLKAFGADDETKRIGVMAGAFEIAELIKSGGMGVVYRGERKDGVFEQSVAIKILPHRRMTPARRTLFERERAFLARLEHPNIARIIDGGLLDDGAPYLAMEFVGGERFDEAVRTMPRKQRIAAFDQLCEAVSYCHRSFIVHGDLKPENILIADDRVRLLDLGVSRLIDRDNKANDSLVGATPDFAAPELLNGAPASVASDIFALGKILRRALEETAPSPELNAIIAKCLNADETARYLSVESLRNDLANFQQSRPVAAYSAKRRYRATKFIARNRVAVGATAIVIASLAAGLFATNWQYAAAKREAARANAVSSFVISLFDRANPDAAGASAITLRDIMDEAAQRVEAELSAAPEAQREVQELIASGYFGLGEYELALQLNEDLLGYLKETRTTPDADIARAQNRLASAYVAVGRNEEGVALLRDAIAQLELLGSSIHRNDVQQL